MALLPGSEHYDENGNVTHFGIIDPITGEPILIPHVGGNYAMFGGGSGAQELQNGGNSGGAAPQGGGMPPPDPSADAPMGAAPEMVGGAPPPPAAIGNDAPAPSVSAAAPPPAVIPETPELLKRPPESTPGNVNTQNNGAAPAFDPKSLTVAPVNPMAGMETKTSSATQSHVDPKLIKQMDDATHAISKANESEAHAKIAENGVRIAQAEADSNLLREHQEKVDAERADYQKRLEVRQKEIEDLTEKYSNTKIDAANFWHESGTGTKVAAGIAIALGALGGALNGSNQNVGLDIINKAIDRDIHAQEVNLNKQGQAITQKRGLLSDYREQFGDDAKAKEAAFITYQKSIANHFESLAAGARDEGTKAIAEKASQELKMNNAARIAELTKSTTSQSTTTAPIVKPTPLDPQASKAHRVFTNKANQLADVIDHLETPEGAEAFGKGAAVSKYLTEALGLPSNASRLEVQTKIPQIIIDSYNMTGTPLSGEREKEIKETYTKTRMSPQDMVVRLKVERQRMMDEAKGIERDGAQENHIVPQATLRQTNSELRAKYGTKK